ncbi:MAG TPA: glycosyltransferase family 2 protein [Vicinamibacterales bacterium]|nr:glycosyltransferase family 2 protein [Vicinamibacterales bacterium]
MPPDLSVVIPTLNRRDTLAHVLPALAAQTYPASRFEIMLCDAGSTDGTAQLVKEMQLPNLHWLPAPDAGRAGARNRGVAAARGQIVVFTDADTIPEADWLEAHADAHVTRSETAIVGCEIQVDDINEIESVRRDPKRRRTRHPDNRSRLSWMYFLTGNASVPRGLLVQCGPFDESFTGYGHEDLELGYRLARSGVAIRYLPRAVNYHCHPVPLEERCEKMRMAGASTVRFYRKHRDPRIALRLGLNPLSWAWHALMPEGGSLWRHCRSRMGTVSVARTVALQHAYLSGLKKEWRAAAIDRVVERSDRRRHPARQ